MAVNVQEVLVVDAVLVGLALLRDESEIAACGEMMEEEIFGDRLVLAQQHRPSATVEGQLLRLHRNRLAVETSPARTRVLREYPTGIDDVGLVSRLTEQAIAATDLQGESPAAVGFNIQIVYDQDSGVPATQYLGSRLFHPVENLLEDWIQVGGFGKLIFQASDRQWTLNLQPRMHAPNTTKVFLDVNLQLSEAQLPTKKELDSSLKELWTQAHSLIQTIDSGLND